jgi:hypothetical protein
MILYLQLSSCLYSLSFYLNAVRLQLNFFYFRLDPHAWLDLQEKLFLCIVVIIASTEQAFSPAIPACLKPSISIDALPELNPVFFPAETLPLYC